MPIKTRLHPFLWGALCMVLTQGLTYFLLPKEKVIFEESGFVSPDVSLLPVILYFFGVVAVVAVVLFLIPVNKLRLVFKIVFALMFGWGAFYVTTVIFSTMPAYFVAVIAAAAWFFWGRVWLHNLLLLITLAAAATLFGFLFAPLTFLIFILIISVYDVVAVRFGFMVWMADRLSDFDAIPAFIFPRRIKDWRLGLGSVRLSELIDKKPEIREYTILGGGDIGIPVMLAVSVYFKADLAGAAIVGGAALGGLMGAFLVQALWLKEKPVPALPPIALGALIGFLIAGPSF